MDRISRRRFLEDSLALLAAGAIPAAAVAESGGRGRRVGPNEKLRVAIIGVHGRGMDHVKELAVMNDVTIAAICDCDTNQFGKAVQACEKAGQPTPKTVQDVRRIMDDKEIDAVSIATQNHWHALMAIWAIQAGKDVYVEKPVSHNVSEGRRIVQAARKYKKIVQTGTQSRSNLQEAMAFLHDGGIGHIHVSRGLCYKSRGSIGKLPDGEVPSGVDYNLWLGPAPLNHFNPNRFHYNWHWNWDYGCGDIGNQGIHEMDKARWALNKHSLPNSVVSLGGRFGYEDDGQTPNTQLAVFDYGDSKLIFEVRGLKTEPLVPGKTGVGAMVGNIYYGEKGIMVGPSYNQAVVFDNDGNKVREFRASKSHFRNWLDAVRSRKQEELNADIEEGHLSSALCHLANVSYRLGQEQTFDTRTKAFGDDKDAYEAFGRVEEHLAANGVSLKDTKYMLGRDLKIDPAKEVFIGDRQADQKLTRRYREPFVVPKSV